MRTVGAKEKGGGGQARASRVAGVGSRLTWRNRRVGEGERGGWGKVILVDSRCRAAFGRMLCWVRVLDVSSVLELVLDAKASFDESELVLDAKLQCQSLCLMLSFV